MKKNRWMHGVHMWRRKEFITLWLGSVVATINQVHCLPPWNLWKPMDLGYTLVRSLMLINWSPKHLLSAIPILQLPYASLLIGLQMPFSRQFVAVLDFSNALRRLTLNAEYLPHLSLTFPVHHYQQLERHHPECWSAEIFIVLCTFASQDELSALAEQLGRWLEYESTLAQG